jgi:hypothetical protein
MLDFAAIKERIAIERVLPLLQLNLRHANNQYRGPCPTCKSGGDRALVITPGKEAFYCFGSKRGGDVIALVAHIRGMQQREAAAFIVEQFQLDGGNSNISTDNISSRNSSPEPRPATVEAKGRRGPLTALDYLVSNHPVIGLLGLSAASIEALGGGFAPKGTMIGRIVIPLRLPEGELVGYLGIATRPDQSPLLKFPPNLDEMIASKPTPPAEPEPEQAEASPEELRKMFRVVG